MTGAAGLQPAGRAGHDFFPVTAAAVVLEVGPWQDIDAGRQFGVAFVTTAGAFDLNSGAARS